MPTTLIIVESPAKTRTLRSFLGEGFRAEASMGHVRDLPEKVLGVNIEKGFKPKYVIIPERHDAIKRLREAVAKADRVLLASDPDREGEAIAYHLAHVLKLQNPERIEFNEITRSAVLNAIEHPRPIDMRRVDAQEARRVLDRLVGYKLSPLLWRKVRKGLSAGRVQSVVLRLICDREREIASFQPQEYWTITARLSPRPPEEPAPFEARLVQRDHRKIELKTREDADGVLAELQGAEYRVGSVRKREQKRRPSPPFTTSTLQQEAARKLGFSNRKTMMVAQQLYEGVQLGDEGHVGLITYMRSDSVRVAPEAQAQARKFLEEWLGDRYLPRTPPVYKTKGPAQDAHEAIRPTSVFRRPESVAPHLTEDERKLYKLIWERFIASQMAPALLEVTTVDVAAGRYTFRASGSVVVFDGFLRVYAEATPERSKDETGDEAEEPTGLLPPLNVGQLLDLLELLPKQHFTEPPPRYTEATLVKTLDELGIGRPSTWASFISTILDRKYAILEDRKFRPTELGFTVNDLLVKHFPDIMDYDFTSQMETRLDEIEEGRADKLEILRAFFEPFQRAVEAAHEQMESQKPPAQETDILCPNCGKKMLLRQSERGAFLGCSGYPRCRTILKPDGTPPEVAQPEASGKTCPKCGKPMVIRSSKYGRFLGCSGYPKCRTVEPLEGVQNPHQEGPSRGTGIPCPKDGGEIIEKRSRRNAVFYGCSNYPACDFLTWHRPVGRPCPACGWPLGERAYRGKLTGQILCTNPDCGYKEAAGQSSKQAVEETPASDTP